MKSENKKWILAGIFVIVICLILKYWENIIYCGLIVIDILSPLIIGCVIAYIVNILMNFYERKILARVRYRYIDKHKRIISMIMAFGSIIMFVVIILLIIIPELKSCIEVLIKSLPETVYRIEQFLINKFGDVSYLKISDVKWDNVINEILKWGRTGLSSTVDTVLGYVTTVVMMMVNLVLGFIFSMYILVQKEKLKDQICRCLDAYIRKDIIEKIVNVLKVLDTSFHNFIVGQCTDAFILGVMCVCGMLIFRFPYAVMIGVLIGCTALIPIAGAYIGAIVGVVMIFTESPLKAVMFVVFIVALQQLEGQFIYPKIVGSSIGLPGIWVFAAVIVCGGLFGIMGMLFGIPIISAVYTILKDNVNRRTKYEK